MASVQPDALGLIGRPASAEELAALLAQAQAARQAVIPWGAGTHQHLGGPPPAGALRLDTGALDRVVDYVPEDLTITLQAGVTIGALQELLASRSQWLPWEPSGGPRATLGGLLASGGSGPLRLAYGTPRDWVLGMQVALGDGRLARSGSRVVKNVAGYDMHKLHLGALGTLGVITEVTLKVLPLPEQQASLLAGFAGRAAALDAAEALRAQPLAPVALALLAAPAAHRLAPLGEHCERWGAAYMLLARYVGTPAAVARQIAVARTRADARGGRCATLAEGTSPALWATLPSLLDHDPAAGPLLRLGVAPASLSTALDILTSVDDTVDLLALPGVGLAWLRLPPATTNLVEKLARLRAALAATGGYVVVEDSPAEQNLDRWGPAPPTLALMRLLRQQWDPAGILNPGRFLVS